jgi:hypothetical protein
MRRDDQGDDHQDHGSREYLDYTGDAHEEPVLACLSLLSFNGSLGLGG